MAESIQKPKIKPIEIRPQEGYQIKFLSSPADIVIGGGAAGAGKTFSLLIDVARYLSIKGFGAVIFRRTTPQIRNEGGLWDTSRDIFNILGGVPKESTLEWNFPFGTSVKMNHLEYEKNVNDHQGAQYTYIGFDELCHFTRRQFFYLLTRNRSLCGVPPCIRATCNPDPDSWVAEFIEWWIDQETGFPIPERDGVIRYFTVDEGVLVWGDTKQEVIEKCPHIFGALHEDVSADDMVKSATFVFGNIYHNKILIKKNPQYLANLMAQDAADRSTLLDGNWKIKQDDNALCDYLKVNDLFSNFPDEFERDESGNFKVDQNGNNIKVKIKTRITCDAARFGRDFAVIIGWANLQIKYIWVRTKSKTSELVADIEAMRALLQCGKSDVLVDQDGVGGGVVDEGGYLGFSGGGSVLEDPNTKIKENYSDLKTQCYYRFSEKVNDGVVSAASAQIKVDGMVTDTVVMGKQIFEIEKLIKQDLRSFKRERIDDNGKKRMNDKKQQKVILGGRSPDFGDAIMMREWFELKPIRKFTFISLNR